jgi:dihydrodipicolinate synthase/N-acetylneuraminate lyase
LDVATVVELSTHPNIAGIKCSGDLNDALELIACVDAGFRVIVAQADQVDVLCEQGVVHHLDGVFSLAPEWTMEIARASAGGDWIAAAEAQRRVSGILRLLREYGVFPSYNELMHARGIPGLFAPRPFQLLNDAQRRSLLSQPLADALARLGDGCERKYVDHDGAGRKFVPGDGAAAHANKNVQAR